MKEEKVLSVIKKHCPLICTIGILWIIIAVLLASSLRHNNGNFVYALDDTYIHMAMAKNIAQHGVWGINQNEFASLSSSPLWTLLLAFFYIPVGVHASIPFILNVLFASLLVYTAYVILQSYHSPQFYTFGVLLFLVFVTPLPSLVFTGLEHLLHAFLTIVFVFQCAKFFTHQEGTLSPNKRSFGKILLLAPLVVAARYEGLFLIAATTFLFLQKRKFAQAAYLVLAAAFPVLIVGTISLLHGWYFLPTSVLLNGQRPDFSSFKGIMMVLGYSSCVQLAGSTEVLILVVAALTAFVFRYQRKEGIWSEPQIMIFLFAVTTFLHMQLAKTGRFYRYEAYLIAFGIVVVAIGMLNSLPVLSSGGKKKFILKQIVAAVLFLIALPSFWLRASDSLKQTVTATTNIYEQQYQMGLFLKSFYDGDTVAANDIGAISYLATIRCLDLWGLANVTVAQLRVEKRYNTKQIEKLTKQEKAHIGILYDHWFTLYGGLPPQWFKIGEWTIPNNVVCGGSTISFYAFDSTQAKRLEKNLRAFSSNLPVDVKQTHL